jgi:hypothetical protein
MKTVAWKAGDGREFLFQVCSHAGNWSDAGGIYVFSKFVAATGGWDAFYIGKCESFKTRIPGHERWQEAVRTGAENVLACPIEQAGLREAVEAAMIQQFDPPLNKQQPVYQSRYAS